MLKIPLWFEVDLAHKNLLHDVDFICNFAIEILINQSHSLNIKHFVAHLHYLK